MKRLMSLLLAVIMALGLFVVSASAAYPDVTDQQTQDNVAVLQMLGVINGFEDGTFRPNDKLTRAQFTKMAITVSQSGANTAQYQNLTIFPDVRASHWASGYINYAVREAKIIAGMPNGNFEPDTVVTYGQAVTILMRLNGYSDETLGSNWPMGYINEANNIGLTKDISAGAGAEITRAQAAQLFVNLLSCKDEEGNMYVDKISSERIDNVILTSLNATASDGSTGNVQTAGASTEVYKPLNEVPTEFQGRQGSIILNARGYLIAFLPDRDSSYKTLTLSVVTATYLTGKDGTRVNIPTGTSIYINGEESLYSEVWMDIGVGSEITVFYTSAGKCDYLVMSTSAASGTVAVLKDEPVGNPFVSLLGLPNGSYAVMKNGSAASASDLRQYDVGVYNALTKTIYVSDLRLCGIYESAYPNTQTPSKITVMGTEFELLETALEDVEGVALGGYVTLLMTDDGRVAGVLTGGKDNGTALGIFESYNADGKAEVKLFNGLTVSGSIGNGSELLGEVVRVISERKGYLSVYKPTAANISGSLDVAKQTVGGVSLTDSAVILDRSCQGVVVRVNLEDIALSSVSAGKIYYVGKDYAGKVNVVILSGVTGDGYTYGFLRHDVETVSSGGMTASNPTIAVENSGGTTAERVTSGATSSMNNKPGGLAVNKNGEYEDIVLLTEIKGLSRSAFAGGEYLNNNGVMIPLAADLQVYIKDKDEWTDLTAARAYSNNLYAYYDRTVEEGGKVRLVVAY